METDPQLLRFSHPKHISAIVRRTGLLVGAAARGEGVTKRLLTRPIVDAHLALDVCRGHGIPPAPLWVDVGLLGERDLDRQGERTKKCGREKKKGDEESPLPGLSITGNVLFLPRRVPTFVELGVEKRSTGS